MQLQQIVVAGWCVVVAPFPPLRHTFLPMLPSMSISPARGITLRLVKALDDRKGAACVRETAGEDRLLQIIFVVWAWVGEGREQRRETQSHQYLL